MGAMSGMAPRRTGRRDVAGPDASWGSPAASGRRVLGPTRPGPAHVNRANTTTNFKPCCNQQRLTCRLHAQARGARGPGSGGISGSCRRIPGPSTRPPPSTWGVGRACVGRARSKRPKRPVRAVFPGK